MGLARDLRSRRVIPLREVVVTAWANEEGCTAISCYDLDQLQKKHPKFLESTTIGAMVDLILMKATDEGGEKLFKHAEDRIDLMGEETAVISSIAQQMFAEIESVENQIKN